MDDATAAMMIFLNNPEIDFGDNPLDVEMLANPELLREKVSAAIDKLPVGSKPTTPDGRDLRAILDEVNWAALSTELQNRLGNADRFFDHENQRPADSSRLG